MSKKLYKKPSPTLGVNLVYNYKNNSVDNNDQLTNYIANEPEFINSYIEGTDNNPIGLSILLYAYEKDDIALISFLFDKGFNINFRDHLNEPIINTIIKQSQYKDSDIVQNVLKLFVQKGANLNITNVDNETPIFMAVKKKVSSAVEYLLEQEKVDVHISAIYKQQEGHSKSVSLLSKVSKGSEIYDIFCKTGHVFNEPISLDSKSQNISQFELIFENIGNDNPKLEQNITVIQGLFAKSSEIKNLIKSATNKAGSNITVKFDKNADCMAHWDNQLKSIIIKSELPIYFQFYTILFELCNADNERINNLINFKDESHIYKSPYKYSLFMEKYECNSLKTINPIVQNFLASTEKDYILQTFFDNNQAKYDETLKHLKQDNFFDKKYFLEQIASNHATRYCRQWEKNFLHKLSLEEYNKAINNYSFDEAIKMGEESGLFENDQV